MLYQSLINNLVDAAEEIIGAQLTGIYLHGSLAMGCFNPKKSDIDFIIVVEEPISDAQKMQFLQQVVALNRQAPAKGLELSLVLRRCCNPFLYPTPFELHFSPTHLQWLRDDPQGYVAHMNGADPDLAAHFTMIRHYGVTLYGAPIETVFGEVPRSAYADSIWKDVESAVEDIVEYPIDVTLNLCRVLAFFKDNLYLSKKDGGTWAMEHLPAGDAAVAASALACYQSDQAMRLSEIQAKAFAKTLLAAIRAEM